MIQAGQGLGDSIVIQTGQGLADSTYSEAGWAGFGGSVGKLMGRCRRNSLLKGIVRCIQGIMDSRVLWIPWVL